MISYGLSHEGYIFSCSSACIESCGSLYEIYSCFHGNLAGFCDLFLGKEAGLQDDLNDAVEGSCCVADCADVISDIVVVS